MSFYEFLLQFRDYPGHFRRYHRLDFVLLEHFHAFQYFNRIFYMWKSLQFHRRKILVRQFIQSLPKVVLFSSKITWLFTWHWNHIKLNSCCKSGSINFRCKRTVLTIQIPFCWLRKTPGCLRFPKKYGDFCGILSSRPIERYIFIK